MARWIRLGMAACALVTIGLPSLAGQDAKPTLDDLAFMAGSWEAPLFGGTYHENWTPARGGVMLGHGSLMIEGRMVNCELMSIEQVGDEIALFVMLGRPSQGEKKPERFALKSLEDGKATFFSEENEMPDTIVYWKDGDGMGCYIEGDEGGERERIDFEFTPATE